MTEATPAQAAEKIYEYWSHLDLERQNWSNVLSGPADGGPNGDGYYPYTLFNGNVLMIPSTAKLEELVGDGTPLPEEVAALPAATSADVTASLQVVGRKGPGEPPKLFAPNLFAQGRTRDLADVSAILGTELIPCFTSEGGGQDKRFGLAQLGKFMTGGVINPKLPPYNCKGDTQEVNDVQSTAGSPIVTSSTGMFRPDDVGKLAYLTNAASGFGVLATTIASYQSPTQVTLATNAGVSRANNGMLWGTDDTVGMTQAMLDAAPRGPLSFGGMVLLQAGWYLVGPQVFQPRTALAGYGSGRICALVRKPDGTSNPLLANKTYALSADLRKDDFPIIEGIGLHGARYYQTAGLANTCFYWNGGIGSTQLSQIDPFIRINNVEVWEASSTAFRVRGRGAGLISNLLLTGGWGEGLLYEAYDTTINGVQTQNFLQAGLHIGAGGANSTFTGLKASYNGTGSSVANATQDRCCNMLVEGQGCTFDGTLLQEPCGSNIVIKGRRHTFMGLMMQDTGDTWPVGGNGSGGGLLPFRADVVLAGSTCQDNLIMDSMAMGSVHEEVYATHGLYLTGYPSRNRGRMWSAPVGRTYYNGGTAPNGSTIPGGTGVYAPAAVGNDSSGSRASNPIVFDGTTI
jgi:hypothetical protein